MHCAGILLRAGVDRLVLDWRAVPQIEVRGLGTVLEILVLAGRPGASVRIVGPATNHLMAVRILTLDATFSSLPRF
jgi:hypothetical protein